MTPEAVALFDLRSEVAEAIETRMTQGRASRPSVDPTKEEP